MFKTHVVLIFLTQLLINFSMSALPENSMETTDECLSNSLEASWICRGSRVVHNVLNNLSKTDKPLVIVRGFEIVPSPQMANSSDSIRESNATMVAKNRIVADDNDDTFLGRFARYLRTHELNIKFSELMADEREQYLARDSETNGIPMDHINEARKKDKGNGMAMLLALMFSKMMAVMGLGGIGALAMKALGVAMAALMMAAMVGLKSLSHQGQESTHSVQYVTADGHHHGHRRRRRRSVKNIFSNINHGNIKTAQPLAYKGWPSSGVYTKNINE